MKHLKVSLFIILIVLFADQGLKIWIKLNMYLGQEYFILGDWFRIHFTENEGMAFGMTLGGEYGKIILSLFRIVAVMFIGVYMIHLMKNNSPRGLIFSLALIFAGAMGNIIDSVCYGLIFTDSISKVAAAFPEAGGYAPLFYGKVVDMLYFPVYQGFLPGWIPKWGDTYFIFFRPVFNIADAAISAGVFAIIIFQKSFFVEEDSEETANPEEIIEKNNTTVKENPETKAS